MLLDTCVLIDYFRHHAPACSFIENLGDVLTLSAMTVAELYRGVRPQEMDMLEFFLSQCTILPVNKEIAKVGGLIEKQYAKSHGTDMVDALLAATAQEHTLRLVTLNTKHFPMLPDVLKPY
jgi:predicted nucleic acid-binding protein